MIPALLLLAGPGCAPWIFRSLGNDCDGVGTVEVVAADAVNVLHRLLPEGDGPLEHETSCYVDARATAAAPLLEPTDERLTVSFANEVEVYGVQDLLVVWGPDTGLSSVVNDLGSVRGRGAAEILFGNDGVEQTVDVLCPDCRVVLSVPPSMTVGILAARSVLLCTRGSGRPLEAFADAVAASASSIVVDDRGVMIDGLLVGPDTRLETLCDLTDR